MSSYTDYLRELFYTPGKPGAFAGPEKLYQAVKLESYIASPIKNREEQVVGTLNFTSLYPHAPKFDLDETELVEQFSRKVAENIEFYKILSLRATNA